MSSILSKFIDPPDESEMDSIPQNMEAGTMVIFLDNSKNVVSWEYTMVQRNLR
jgi:regulatory protein YycI of two-component signal transduction system YycFG